MKKRAVISLILALVMVLAMITVSFADEPVYSDYYAKVGIAYGGNAPEKFTISASGGLKLSEVYNAEKLPDNSGQSDLDGLSSITVVNDGGVIKVYDTVIYDSDLFDPDLDMICTLAGDGTEFISAASYFDESTPVSYNGKAYRGGIIPYLNSSDQMNIINYVSSDDYVRGVLHAEIGQSSDPEAIKAQAVATRSFAYANKNTHKAQGFGVCNTTHCQVYKGISGEYPSTEAAAAATSGEMIYYNGKPVAVYYCANSGGHTQNSEDVWVSKLGYLRGVKDEYSPEYNWKVELTKAQLDNAVAGRGIGEVTAVSIDSYNSAGAAASVTVHGTEGKYTVKKDNIRSVFSGTSLKSTMFTFSTEGGSTTPVTGGVSQSPEASYYAMDSGGSKVKLGSSLFAVSASGVSKISLGGSYILGADGVKTMAQETGNGGSEDVIAGDVIYLDDDTDKLIINGKGYGHGVGMSQQGAQVMGRMGFTYKEILHYYFTDIEIK